MKSTQPSIEQWRHAYELAGRVRDLAPWTWMWDSDFLAFRDPEDGSPRFVSAMGRRGEHFAIAVYRRVEDVFRVLDLTRDPNPVPETLLDMSQLQLSFEDKDFLEPAERRLIQRLGVRFRGAQAWPCFRSYLPSQFPWSVDSDELRQLVLALELVLAVAPRFRDDQPGLERLNRLGMEDHTFLVHTHTEVAGVHQWEGSMVEFERPVPPEVVQEFDEELLKRVADFPAVKNKLEVDLRLTPSPVQDRKDQRPYFPWTMLVVESGDGFIVGHELLTPLPTVDAVYSRVAGVLLEMLAKHEIQPAEILVRTERVASLLREVCEELGIALTVQSRLPQLEDAFASLNRRFQSRR